MKTNWEAIAEALRNELQDYGELFNLYNKQQDSILARDPEAVVQAAAAIEKHASHLQGLRQDREALVRNFAHENNADPSSTVRSLIKLVEPEVRPLLDALVDEINHLIHRTRRRARQNQLLLARAVEIRQQLLQSLKPEVFSTTYSRGGQVRMAAPALAAGYRAAG